MSWDGQASSSPDRALAVLEWLIAEAERDARRRARVAQRLAWPGGDPTLAHERLGAARKRLALLHRSRHCLLTGDPPDARH